MRAKRINSDIAHIIFFFASGASDFTKESRTDHWSTFEKGSNGNDHVRFH